jgi:lipopolysaccharide/colanic/teichoic acid biosynthesis glycosyltransferase/GGDEF domain-containing protein
MGKRVAKGRLWSSLSPFSRLAPSRVMRGILGAEAFRVLLDRERERADRNSHQFSVLIFDVHTGNGDGLIARRLLDAIERRARLADEVGWYDQDHLAVMLPDTNAAGASRLAEDLRAALSGPGAPLPACRVFTYDSDPTSTRDRRPPTVGGAAGGTASRAANLPTGARLPDAAPAPDPQAVPVADADLLFIPPEPPWKRPLDILGAILGIILTAPLMLVVALAVKLTSRGPVLFRQERAGLGGRPFAFYKFRSMVVDAEAHKHELLALNERNGPVFKVKNDPRITPVGRFIRKWSLDELPQFFNVLKGDMSLVGPRPPTLDEVPQYRKWHAGRLRVKPGITCIWQVTARHLRDFDTWVRLDIRYQRERSFLLDLKILFCTLPAVLLRRGAC